MPAPVSTMPMDKEPKRGSLLHELRALTIIALPLAATYLAEVAMIITDRIIVGRIGAVELGAVGLMGDVMLELLVVAMSIVSIVGVLVSQSLGAGTEHLIRRQVRQGLVVGTAIALPFTILIWHLPDILSLTRQDPRVIEIGRQYLEAAVWFILPSVLFVALRQFLAALARVRPVMVITVSAIALNLVLTYGLVFGAFGLPAMGVAGAGWATTIVSWTMFAALAFHVIRAPGLREYRMFVNLARIDVPICREILRLGLPIGGLTFLESGMFGAVAIMMGVLGTTELAANQVLISLTATSFVLVVSIGEATAIRVAYGVGSGDRMLVRRAGALGLSVGVVVMGLAAMAYLTIPDMLTGIFIDTTAPENQKVVTLAATLFAIAALFQVSDGIQAIMSRALRGMRDTLAPLWIAAFGYWGLGILGGFVLAFPMEFGAVGLWSGLALGLSTTAVLLTWRFHKLSRWSKSKPASSSTSA